MTLRTTTRKRTPASCTHGRCTRRRAVVLGPDEQLCSTHARFEADHLVGTFVKQRDARCVLRGFRPDLACYSDELYWCHLIPKGRYPWLRYDPANAVAGCATHHKAFDTSPLEAREWAANHVGPELWERMESDAVEHRGASPEVDAVIIEFRKRVAT